MYVYIYAKAEGVYIVGFFTPDAKMQDWLWNPESDWDTKEQAASRVHFLNGGDREMAWQISPKEWCNGTQ